MTELTNMTRRGVLTASAWSVPAVTLASAAPTYAASTALYALSVPPVAPGGTVQAVVSFGAGALPVAPDTVTLTLQLMSPTGSIASTSFVGTWTYSWPTLGLLQFFATPAATAVNTFAINLTGPSTWRFTLTTPTETVSQQVEVVAAAGRVQGVPLVDDPSMRTIEPEW